MIKIFIVDDHPIVAQGLKQMLEMQSDMKVVGMAHNLNEAEKSIETNTCDIVTVDLSLKGESGLQLIAGLKKQNKTMKMLVVSMFDEEEYAEKAFKAGAMGYVMKQEAPETIVDAIKMIYSGKRFMSEGVRDIIMEQAISGEGQNVNSPAMLLSSQELKVFHLFGRGKSLNEIADSLAVSKKTVETYFSRIKSKLDLSNNRELLQKAIQWSNLSEEF